MTTPNNTATTQHIPLSRFWGAGGIATGNPVGARRELIYRVTEGHWKHFPDRKEIEALASGKVWECGCPDCRPDAYR